MSYVINHDASHELKMFKHLFLQCDNHFSQQGLSYLVDNFIEALTAKNITTIDGGIAITEWREWFNNRIGKEPLIRLLFVFFKSLSSSGVEFHEVMTEEPKYYIECLNNNKYLDYYYKWQNKQTGPTGTALDEIFEPRGMNGPNG